MSEATENILVKKLSAQLGEKIAAIYEYLNEITLEILPENWLHVAQILRDELQFSFAQLIDLCAIDYLSFGQDEWDTENVSSEGFSRGVKGEGPGRFSWKDRPRPEHRPKRFAVVVHLLSITHNQRLRLRCYCNDDALPLIPSLMSVWPVANWFEREAFDLFGIVFEGHPDLRRILTDYGFIGHPFRKDFPLIGNVEVSYDEKQERVIYQPVSIEPRVLVPRVIRHDSRYEQARAENEPSEKRT